MAPETGMHYCVIDQKEGDSVSEDPKTKTCFVICPIGDEGTETRKRSDQVLKHIIEPAVKDCAYESPVRADAIAEPGNITSQVIQRVYEADLVVADLTKHNPNVFYELAIRHAARKPIILIMEPISDYETIPFDVAQDRVIYFDHKDLDSVAQCKKNMIKQIHSIQEKNTSNDSPISFALDIKLLRESGDTQKEYFGEILEILMAIRHIVTTGQGSRDAFTADPNFIHEVLLAWQELQSSIRQLHRENRFEDSEEFVSNYSQITTAMNTLMKTFEGQGHNFIPF